MSSSASAAALDPSSDPPPFRVAVVGGGLAGAAAASTLAADAKSRVTLFDAGFRGVGGRASSRPLLNRKAASEAGSDGGKGKGNPIPNPTTDHGCQFVVDDGADSRLTALLREHATEWKENDSEGGEARFVSLDAETGRIRAKGELKEEEGDFFGVLSKGSAVCVGNPTIDAIPCRLVGGSSSIEVRVGWKVTALASAADGAGWRVSARAPPPPPGTSAAPSPPPPPAAAVEEGLFDAVVLSDASALRAGSANAVAVDLGPASSSSAPLEALARSRRAPLFSVAALLPKPLDRISIPFDVAIVRGKSDVSVIVRESAKPGRKEGGEGEGEEVWVAVSSRKAAAELLALAPPSKGPPPPEALERAAERLWASASEALQRAAAASGERESLAIPKPLALRAQRWGAGVETNPDSEALFSLDAGAMLVSCGDVFGRGDAASALLSGVAAGEALLRAAAEKRKMATKGARSSL